jgi:hypothetical protein
MEDDIEIIVPEEYQRIFDSRFANGGSFECTFCGKEIPILKLVRHMSTCLW